MGFFDIFKSGSGALDAATQVVTKTTDGIISGLDHKNFTDQERAELAKKVYDAFLPAWVEMQKTLATESTGSAISRRILAFMIMGVFLGLIVGAAIAYKFDATWAGFILKEGVDRLEFLAGGVGLTYFMYHGITKFFTAKQA